MIIIKMVVAYTEKKLGDKNFSFWKCNCGLDFHIWEIPFKDLEETSYKVYQSTMWRLLQLYRVQRWLEEAVKGFFWKQQKLHKNDEKGKDEKKNESV